MSTAVEHDVDLEALLDEELPCQYDSEGDGCPAPATWGARLMCCGTRAVICDDHLVALKRFIVHAGGAVICNTCGNPRTTLKFWKL